MSNDALLIVHVEQRRHRAVPHKPTQSRQFTLLGGAALTFVSSTLAKSGGQNTERDGGGWRVCVGKGEGVVVTRVLKC